MIVCLLVWQWDPHVSLTHRWWPLIGITNRGGRNGHILIWRGIDVLFSRFPSTEKPQDALATVVVNILGHLEVRNCSTLPSSVQAMFYFESCQTFFKNKFMPQDMPSCLLKEQAGILNATTFVLYVTITSLVL